MQLMGKLKNVVLIGVTAFFCSILALKNRSKIVKLEKKQIISNTNIQFTRVSGFL